MLMIINKTSNDVIVCQCRHGANLHHSYSAESACCHINNTSQLSRI